MGHNSDWDKVDMIRISRLQLFSRHLLLHSKTIPFFNRMDDESYWMAETTSEEWGPAKNKQCKYPCLPVGSFVEVHNGKTKDFNFVKLTHWRDGVSNLVCSLLLWILVDTILHCNCFTPKAASKKDNKGFMYQLLFWSLKG